MSKRYESIEMPDKCPKCGAPVYRIQYGMPTMSEEEYFNTYHEHVIYGGCCISEDDFQGLKGLTSCYFMRIICLFRKYSYLCPREQKDYDYDSNRVTCGIVT